MQTFPLESNRADHIDCLYNIIYNPKGFQANTKLISKAKQHEKVLSATNQWTDLGKITISYAPARDTNIWRVDLTLRRTAVSWSTWRDTQLLKHHRQWSRAVKSFPVDKETYRKDQAYWVDNHDIKFGGRRQPEWMGTAKPWQSGRSTIGIL